MQKERKTDHPRKKKTGGAAAAAQQQEERENGVDGATRKRRRSDRLPNCRKRNGGKQRQREREREREEREPETDKETGEFGNIRIEMRDRESRRLVDNRETTPLLARS